jgi:hypothetical protein
VCNHAPVPLVVVTVLLWLLRRVRPASVAFMVYEAWRRLPPQQRRQLLLVARRNAPRIASALARRGRTRL